MRFNTKVKRTKSQPPETRKEFHERFGLDVPDEPDWPEAVDYLWDAFWDISTDRQDGPNGPQPLGSVLIKSWCDLTGTALLSEDVDIIRAMDRAFLSAYADEMAAAWKPEPKGKAHD